MTIRYGTFPDEVYALEYGFLPEENPHNDVELFSGCEALISFMGALQGKVYGSRQLAQAAADLEQRLQLDKADRWGPQQQHDGAVVCRDVQQQECTWLVSRSVDAQPYRPCQLGEWAVARSCHALQVVLESRGAHSHMMCAGWLSLVMALQAAWWQLWSASWVESRSRMVRLVSHVSAELSTTCYRAA